MPMRYPKAAVAVFIHKGKKLLMGKRRACVAHSCFSIPRGRLEFWCVAFSALFHSSKFILLLRAHKYLALFFSFLRYKEG